ncbi:YopX family protein [Geotalea uraniireducens]|uniref:YopX protein domain-containing protein n=1 Tax=Geotalea uraniireducens (strain Rf4) TaxID=351605 RepID=A5G7A6_GEOUR|nr:YopX family protein [Geotalea uraniireducens]ABQ27674.1 hypothetical protein Gura_3519 [Geotalea uraniireducens Rf4]
MVREYKFRAWGPKSKCMWPWEEITELPISALAGESGEFRYMQFTGHWDKNGKEIYEGDIVEAVRQGQHVVCEVRWGKECAGFVLYRESGGIRWNLTGGDADSTEQSVEVIGNIYENANLLGRQHYKSGLLCRITDEEQTVPL